ncbi:SdpI family protein [Marinilactibacillus piezotolerans]|uniref:SdpI family protein n=1 Tax=Marinilactibacillus piezotolerans TaxID=258723 RepID=UPI0015C4CEA6|nr:SdpI family protein [Marinilactibacillus piezotolerans]
MFNSDNRNKQILWLTTAICLLPAVIGLVLYNQLPEQLPIHWNSAGEIDQTASKPLVIFGLPIFFIVIHLIVLFAVLNDPKKQNQSKWMKRFTYWIVPVLSLTTMPLTYLVALGSDISVPFVISLGVSIVLIIIGNYLPKSRQNYTIGIKLPWTLNDPDNWNKTHRVGGICFMVGGVLLFLGNILQFLYFDSSWFAVMIVVVILGMVLIPAIYSFLLYRKKS